MAIKGEKRKLGFKGEGKAARYLKKRGYKIIKRNYKCPFGEIDIIAEQGGVVAFIEVKTRTGDYFGEPNQAVNRLRMTRYKNSARFFFAHKTVDCTVRFDIVEVTGKGVNHIENAFY